MARVAITLLLGAMLVVAAVATGPTPVYLEERETAIFFPVAGTVQDYLEYDKLREFCDTMKATLPIQLCEIFDISNHRSSAGSVNGVWLGVYFFTNASAAENITVPTTVASTTVADPRVSGFTAASTDANKPKFVKIVNDAFANDTNVGGVIRIADVVFAMPRRADTASTFSDATPGGSKPGVAPAHFTPLTITLSIVFTIDDETDRTKDKLYDKLRGMPLIVWVEDMISNDYPTLVDGKDVAVAVPRITGYFENNAAMQAAVEAYLTNTTVTPVYTLLSVIDTTGQVTGDDTESSTSSDFVGDAVSQDDSDLDSFYPAYLLNIFFTRAQDDSNNLPTDVFTKEVAAIFFPSSILPVATKVVGEETGASTSSSRVQVILQISYASDVLRALKIAHDIVSDPATNTIAQQTLTGVSSASIELGTSWKGNSFRIPTTDFPLEQQFFLMTDSFGGILNNSVAVNQICTDFIEKNSPNITGCRIHMLSDGMPRNNSTSNQFYNPLGISGATSPGSTYWRNTHGGLELILTASNASTAMQLRQNVVDLLNAGPTDGLVKAVFGLSMFEKRWKSADMKHVFYLYATFPNTSSSSYYDRTTWYNPDERYDQSYSTIFDQELLGYYCLGFTGKKDVNMSTGNGYEFNTFTDSGVRVRFWLETPQAITPQHARYMMYAYLDYQSTVDATVDERTFSIDNITATNNVAYETWIMVRLPDVDNLEEDFDTDYDTIIFEDVMQQIFPTAESAVADLYTDSDDSCDDNSDCYYNGGIRLFTFTPEAAASLVLQTRDTLVYRNETPFNIGLLPIFHNSTAGSVNIIVVEPALNYTDFPAPPVPPATVPATPPTTPPVTAPLSPIPPTLVPPGSVIGVRVGLNFYILVPVGTTSFDSATFCANLAGQGRKYGVRKCEVKDVQLHQPRPDHNLAAKLAVQEGEEYALVTTEVTTDTQAEAAALASNVIAGVNSGTFLTGYTIADVNLASLAPGDNTGGVPVPSAPIVPSSAAPTVSNGTFITVDIYIVILGTALDSAGQAAVNNECGSLLGGGSTCTTKNVEQTTAARKMTAQASALRLTETVRAPQATYANVNAVVARLQAAVRSNNGRLGGQQVVSISAVPSGSTGAFAGPTPALLATLLLAAMSALAALF